MSLQNNNYGQPDGYYSAPVNRSSSTSQSFGQSQQWSQSYPPPAQSYNDATNVPRSGPSMSNHLGDLDLSVFNHPDQRLVESLDVNYLTRPEHDQPWAGRPQAPMPPPGWSSRAQTRQGGAMSDPLPGQPFQDEVSCSHSTTSVSETPESGYHSYPTTAGVPNLDRYNSNEQELAQGYFTALPDKLDESARQSRPPLPPRSAASEVQHLRLPSANSRKRANGQNVPPCPVCHRVAKNRSDAAKHLKQHTRPYSCREPGCPRREGFATSNDLERHRKAVHHLEPRVGDRSGFVCAACVAAGAEKEPKWWPRLDNFKAHVSRKHKDWNQTLLIQK